MRQKIGRSRVLRACVALAIFVTGVLVALPALAADTSVQGADAVLDGGKEVDILTVTGQEGKTVYVNLAKADGSKELLASHLAYTLTDDAGERDANGDIVGVVSVEFSAQAFDPQSTYSVQVFGDREQKDKLYDGTVSCVWAQYGTNEPVVLAVRTLQADESRPFNAPQTQTYNGVTYELESADPKDEGGKQVYVYKESTELEDSATAHVTYYVSGQDAPISQQEVMLAKGESQQVSIPAVVSDDAGNLYRTLQLSGSATLSYPGVTEHNVMCMALSSDWGRVGSFYEATISYVNKDGKRLGVVDTVIVNKPYTYTAPTYLYVTENNEVAEYKIVDPSKATLRLEPGQAQDKTEYQIVYDTVADDDVRTWTVVLQNGTADPKAANRVIKRVTYTGKPGEKVTHTTDQTITVDGKEYMPTAAAQKTYEHTFNKAQADVEQDIYYVPADYVAPEPYDITVKYINIATNEVITSETMTVSPTMRSDLEITSPESFSQGGVEWVRLNGQEKAIRHSYYSAAREYAVYYRDINDDLHAQTVIRTVRVVYVDEEGNTVTRPTTVVDRGTTTTDGGTTTTDGGTTTTDEGTTTTDGGTTTTDGGTTDEGADEGTVTGLPTGTDTLAIDGGDDASSTTTTTDGTDLATTRIEDDQTPLAGPNSAANAASKTNPAVIAGIGAAGAVAAGLVIFFVFKRRNKNTQEPADDESAKQ